MSENQLNHVTSSLIDQNSKPTDFSSYAVNNNNQQQQDQQSTATLHTLNQLNFDSANMMNLNLNGYFLPNHYMSKSNLNLNCLNSGNELLYGGESTTTRSSPLHSLYEISSPDSSNNSKCNKQALQQHHHQKISISSMFENDENLDMEEDDENKHVTKLFVGNLPTSTTLQELLSVFKKFGPVNEKLSVVKDHNYAFIHFYNRKDAQIALKEVNDSLFKDRYIRVQFSTSQGYMCNKFKTLKSDKKRCEFRNDDTIKMKQSNSSYCLNPHSSLIHQQNLTESSDFEESLMYGSNLPQAQFQNALLQNGRLSGSSSAFRPITGSNKLHNSISMNSSFCLPQNNQTMKSLEKLQMQQANNLLMEAHKLTQKKNERNNQYQQFELQQRQNLMHILYLRQLESQQKQQEQQMNQFTRSATMSNLNSNSFSIFNGKDVSPNNLNSNNLLGDMSSLFIDSNVLRQSYNPTTANGLMRSNTMFSFKNN